MKAQSSMGLKPEALKKYKKRIKAIKNAFLKIRKGKHGSTSTKGNKGAWWTKDKGETKKSDTKLSSFREDTQENRKLQKEHKDPSKKTTTYTRVTSKNKDKSSDQHKKKDVKINKVNGSSSSGSSSSGSSSSSGKKKSEMGKAEWLKATRNSPAAKAGMDPNKRWEAQLRHREWKKKRKK